MEEKLKKIKNNKDLAIELLGIFKDGVSSRVIDGKIKPLKYRTSRLQYWADIDGVQIGNIQDFLNICNEYINDSKNNYEIIGRLVVKGENIICAARSD